MMRYIREIKDYSYRRTGFWIDLPDTQKYDFDGLCDWCGLNLNDEAATKPWWQILQRNFTPSQTEYFIRLLQRYGQKSLDNEPQIIIDTIHSVKGGEANNVVLYSKTNWPASYVNKKNANDKSDEKRVYYTGATRARDTLHILSSNYRYNYPIGEDYLIYLREKK